ncbi:MAG: flagellar hook-basal body protein [Verrucomicrobia bacterium]|nr:MAG: flagellar hook-basal body protein [Verrucomicrobiota bacterium]
MIQGIHNTAAAIEAMQRWNDVIARNISAASSPGYKKEVVSFEGVAAGIIDRVQGEEGPEEIERIKPEVSGTVSTGVGQLRHTGDPMEFAIQGRGFFRLQRPDGQYVYTRDGQFHLSPSGELLSKQGFPVMGENGTIQLLIDGGRPVIDTEGRIWQGDQEVGVLSVYDFNDPRLLKRTTGGFVVDPETPQFPESVEFPNIQQGYIEMSNVSPVREMVDLIAVSNALQANQKVIQSLDELTGRAVQVLGNTTA